MIQHHPVTDRTPPLFKTPVQSNSICREMCLFLPTITYAQHNAVTILLQDTFWHRIWEANTSLMHKHLHSLPLVFLQVYQESKSCSPLHNPSIRLFLEHNNLVSHLKHDYSKSTVTTQNGPLPCNQCTSLFLQVKFRQTITNQ